MPPFRLLAHSAIPLGLILLSHFWIADSNAVEPKIVPAAVLNAPADSLASAGPESEPRAPSILRMLEGREQELLVTAGIAVAFFLVGWLCGGIYHVRRERTRRTKLRF